MLIVPRLDRKGVIGVSMNMVGRPVEHNLGQTMFSSLTKQSAQCR